MRSDPRATIVVRAGWRWVAVEAIAEIIGPDDPRAGSMPEAIRRLLREVFVAAGGTHDDWDTYDRTMAEERRAVVVLTPHRTYSNPRLTPVVTGDRTGRGVARPTAVSLERTTGFEPATLTFGRVERSGVVTWAYVP